MNTIKFTPLHTATHTQARELGSQLSPTAPPVDETDLMSDPDMSTVSKASSNYSKVTEEGVW